MRKRQFVRTQVLYLGCRWCSLITVIFLLVGIDKTLQMDCAVYFIMAYVTYPSLWCDLSFKHSHRVLVTFHSCLHQV
ncbi:hypothetical protein BJV74DRAFT_868839 [Russula compacta]|nr:hypothetical protein BJV74DRAFT_868839 [Russula compacta]